MKKIVWFARGGGIAKQGPYNSQAKAAASLIKTDGYPIEDAFVWPEEIDIDEIDK